MTATTDVRPAADQFRLGMLFAIGSAFAFGMSGPLGKSLMEAGWSPTAAVTARLAGGAVAMAVFATADEAATGCARHSQHWKTVVAYGIVPIAGAQLCYYNAVSHLSVGVALLLEYTAPVLVVGWLWATTRRRPSNLTLAGVALAVAGIMLVLERLLRRPHQPGRRRMGPGRRRLRGVLLHDVRRGEHRPDRGRRPEPHHARRRRADRRRRRRRPARRVAA